MVTGITKLFVTQLVTDSGGCHTESKFIRYQRTNPL